MITVYYWKMNWPNVGHAALRIGVGQSSGLDTYVSWWPAANKHDGKITEPSTWLTEPLLPRTYELDIRDEGKPTQTVSISGLDEQAMRREWQNLLKNSPRYCAVRKNCAWTVKYLLDVGTGYNLTAKAADLANWLEFKGIWTPRNTYEYALFVKRNYDAKLKKTNDATNTNPKLRLA